MKISLRFGKNLFYSYAVNKRSENNLNLLLHKTFQEFYYILLEGVMLSSSKQF